MNPMLVALLAIQGVVFLWIALVLASFSAVWLKALLSGASVSFFTWSG